MRVTSIGEFRTEPGTFLEWPVSLGAGTPSSIPPSFNQSFHLSSTLADSSDGEQVAAVWIALAFDVDGSLDINALTWSFEQFVGRHPALRTTFRAVDGDIGRRIHDTADVCVGQPTSITTTDPADLSSHVRARLNHLCHPSQSPSYSFAAVDRPDRSTILCGFDHAHVDAVSMTVVAEELSTLYQARRSSEVVELDPAGSFVDYCAAEAETPVIATSDPRIRAWSEFVAGCGGSTPGFPFDLGVAPGENALQATTIHTLTSGDQAAEFEHVCRDLGAGMFSAVTAAMAEASSGIGGPQQLPLLFPLHTRRESEYAHALGWFTTNAPMRVTVGNTFVDTLASAHASFRAALPLGTVPIPRVLQALGPQFTRSRQDVFMISYIDYRVLPGAEACDRNAHHISNVTTADDAQFWVSRTEDGLFLRARFPDTPEGHAVIERFVARLASVIRACAETTADSYELSLVGPSA